ncbi:hypothetical protein BC939DRAFT_518747 [Gamsiella multidivaricata]|uniref:uncharacterized protein n=1 Tax=Gamsiella multidivaricata TaxID=101098 RepID=UPI00221F30B1|nr:uncharacterized protein BC939DRAFT_518747 [Gamsiella multidivaricata]KAI7821077.1 hypothetical protein BC939DRAFT_518747 [Gamsiella multidivaricata]
MASSDTIVDEMRHAAIKTYTHIFDRFGVDFKIYECYPVPVFIPIPILFRSYCKVLSSDQDHGDIDQRQGEVSDNSRSISNLNHNHNYDNNCLKTNQTSCKETPSGKAKTTSPSTTSATESSTKKKWRRFISLALKANFIKDLRAEQQQIPNFPASLVCRRPKYNFKHDDASRILRMPTTSLPRLNK